MNHRRVVVIITLVLITAGCSSGRDTVAELEQRIAELESQSSDTTTSVATPSTEVTTTTSATTTTMRATTTTTQPDLSALAAVDTEYETAEGWKYHILVTYAMEGPGPSTGQCIKSAPPGLTNLLFLVELGNLQTDRPAETPHLVFVSNLGDGGNPIPTTDPFDDELESALGTLEIFPNAADTVCVLANSLRSESGSIGAGASSEHVLTVGPIKSDRVGDLVLGLRLFKGIGSWVEVVFTPEANSGTITENTGFETGG